MKNKVENNWDFLKQLAQEGEVVVGRKQELIYEDKDNVLLCRRNHIYDDGGENFFQAPKYIDVKFKELICPKVESPVKFFIYISSRKNEEDEIHLCDVEDRDNEYSLGKVKNIDKMDKYIKDKITKYLLLEDR